MGDWLVAFATVVGATMPLAVLLLTLHDRNVRSRRKHEKKMVKRLNHLDACVDLVGQRVARIEGRFETRRRGDVPAILPAE